MGIEVAYIYRIENIITEEFYYGSRLIDKHHSEDLWIDYFTSSKYIKSQIKIYGKESFVTQIVEEHTDPNLCFCNEQLLIKTYIKHPLCVNKHYVNTKKENIYYNIGPRPEMQGIKRPMLEATKIKLRKPKSRYRKSGKLHAAKGTKHSEARIEITRSVNSNSREVSIEGIVYRSCAEASRQLNITLNSVTYRLLNNHEKWNNWFFMKSYTKQVNKTNITNEAAVITTSKPVSIACIIYKSQAEAARQLNTTIWTIKYRCRSSLSKWANWFIID